MQAVLEVTTGPHTGHRIPLSLGVPIRIGRTAKADYVVSEDTFLSGAHFYVEWSGDQCIVRDLNSSNGTFLNGTRTSEASLRDGDVITAGQSSFALHLEAAPAPFSLDETRPLPAGMLSDIRPPAPVADAPLPPGAPPMPPGAPPLPPWAPPPPGYASPSPLVAPTGFGAAPAYAEPQQPAAAPPPPGYAPPPFNAPPAFTAAPAFGEPQQPASAPPPLNMPAPAPFAAPVTEIAMAPPIGPALSPAQKAMLDVLRGLADQVYAVVDGLSAGSFLEVVRSSGGTVDILSDASGAMMTSVNPDSPAAARLAADGWGNGWGVFVTSRQPAAIVRNHLRRFQTLLSSDGVEFQFRYFNPALLRAFLNSLSGEEARSFFGPIGAMLMEGDDAGHLALFMPGPGGTLRKDLPLGSE